MGWVMWQVIKRKIQISCTPQSLFQSDRVFLFETRPNSLTVASLKSLPKNRMASREVELTYDWPISTMTKQKRNPILILTADASRLMPLPLTRVFIDWNIDSRCTTLVPPVGQVCMYTFDNSHHSRSKRKIRTAWQVLRSRHRLNFFIHEMAFKVVFKSRADILTESGIVSNVLITGKLFAFFLWN